MKTIIFLINIVYGFDILHKFGIMDLLGDPLGQRHATTTYNNLDDPIISEKNMCNYETTPNGTLYHLNDIAIKDAKGKQTIEIADSAQNSELKVKFNFCQQPFVNGTAAESNDPYALNIPRNLAYYKTNSSADPVVFTNATFNDNQVLDKENGKVYGFILNFTSEENCTLDASVPAGTKFVISINTYCNPVQETIQELYANEISFQKKCNPQFSFATKMACPLFQKSRFQQMVDRNFWGFGTYFLITGLFLAFAGNYKPQLSIFMCAFDYTFMFTGLAFYSLFLGGTPGWTNFIANPILALLSCLPPYFMATYKRVGISMLSAQCGAMFGLLIVIAFQGQGGKGLYFSFIILPYMAFAVIAWFFHEKFIILATAFLGSYRFVRGVSLFAGGFPNEIEVYSKFKNVDLIEADFPKWFYAYLISIVIIFVLSAYFQYYKGTFSIRSFISFGKDRGEPTYIQKATPTAKEVSAKKRQQKMTKINESSNENDKTEPLLGNKSEDEDKEDIVEESKSMPPPPPLAPAPALIPPPPPADIKKESSVPPPPPAKKEKPPPPPKKEKPPPPPKKEKPPPPPKKEKPAKKEKVVPPPKVQKASGKVAGFVPKDPPAPSKSLPKPPSVPKNPVKRKEPHTFPSIPSSKPIESVKPSAGAFISSQSPFEAEKERLSEDPGFAKYPKMLKMRIPFAQVLQKLSADGSTFGVEHLIYFVSERELENLKKDKIYTGNYKYGVLNK